MLISLIATLLVFVNLGSGAVSGILLRNRPLNKIATTLAILFTIGTAISLYGLGVWSRLQ